MQAEVEDPFFQSLYSTQAKAPTPAKKRPAVPQSTLDLPRAPDPDALVLCQIEAHCSCKAVYLYPSRNLLLRFGKTYTRADKGFTAHSDLPREHLIVKDQILRCEKCF